VKNIASINHLINLKDDKLKLVDVYKNTPPLEQTIKSGKFWPWVKEVEELLSSSEDIPMSRIQQIVHSNIDSSINSLTSLVKTELKNYNSHPLYMARIYPNINDFAIGATLYLGKHVEVGITTLDEELVKARKYKFKDKQTGFFIDASTTILACVNGSVQIGCWTSDETLSENNIPKKFKGTYEESTLQKGELFTIRGTEQGITFTSSDKQAAMIIIKIIKNKPPAALQFDSKSLSLIAVVSSDQASSRFQVASVALRALNNGGDIEILKPYLQHSNAFIRWHSAREIYLRDSAHGKTVFKELLNDRNPMVRDSALRCLNELYGD